MATYYESYLGWGFEGIPGRPLPIYPRYEDTVFDPVCPSDTPVVGERMTGYLAPGNKGGYIMRYRKVVPDYRADPVLVQDFDDCTYHWEYRTKEVPGMVIIIENSDQCCGGHAIVEITRLISKGGKITGAIGKATMDTYELPTNEALVQYLLNADQTLLDGNITLHTNGKHGSYAVVESMKFYHYLGEWRNHGTFHLVKSPIGLTTVEDDFYKDDATAGEKMSVKDFICHHFHNCTMRELFGGFVPFAYGAWNPVRSTRGMSDQVYNDDQAGLITCYEVAHVVYVEMTENNILSFIDRMSLEDLQTAIKDAAAVNQAANTAIQKKIQGRKIPFRMENGKIWLN